jgi:hypothetical protein
MCFIVGAKASNLSGRVEDANAVGRGAENLG